MNNYNIAILNINKIFKIKNVQIQNRITHFLHFIKNTYNVSGAVIRAQYTNTNIKSPLFRRT